MSRTQLPRFAELLLTVGGLLLCLSASAQTDSLAERPAFTVVSSIQPLALIARAVGGESTEINVLIEGHDSAHHFTLSPSDRLAISSADLLLWIGPEFEVFLEPLMARMADHKLITASQLAGMTLHRLGSESIDPHMWLDPENARVLAEAIADQMSDADPERADVYRTNLHEFSNQLQNTADRITSELAALPAFNFAVYHNAYQYFERRFGLEHAVALVNDPETAPSIQQTLRTQAQISESKPACVLVEPDHSPALLATMLQSHEAEIIALDPLGNGLIETDDHDSHDSHDNHEEHAPGLAPQNYSQLLLGISASFQRCADSN